MRQWWRFEGIKKFQFWKWRWILPIPKEADPSLNDLQPLLLFETTRKLWFALVLTKMRVVWERECLLHPTQTTFIKSRSMDLSVLVLMNVLKTGKESDALLSDRSRHEIYLKGLR